MRKLLVLASVIVMTAPAVTLAPTEALASAEGCRNTGTAVGGVSGAVVGGGLAHGGVGGAIVGGLVGAVAGHAIASANCPRGRRWVACRWETHYRYNRAYHVHLCQGRDGVWRRV